MIYNEGNGNCEKNRGGCYNNTKVLLSPVVTGFSGDCKEKLLTKAKNILDSFNVIK